MALKGRFYFRWSVILISIILVFVFFAFYASQFTEAQLELSSNGKTLSIKTSKLYSPPEQIAGLDPQRYHVDSMRGFSFEFPSEKTWSKPKLISGIDAVLEAKGTLLTPELMEQMARTLAIHPMGPMLREVEMIRVISEDSIRIEITDETSNELIDMILARVNGEAQREGAELSNQELDNLRRQLVGFERITFSNEFTVSIYDKNKLKDVPIKLSLPKFYSVISSGLDINSLVAEKESILATVSVSLEHVKINENIKDLRIDRWILLAENQETFFMVEIAYSPQTAESIQIWEELRALMDSFHVIKP